MTSTTPTDLQARMEKLVRELATPMLSRQTTMDEMKSEAAAIVAELPDPDVLAVREILAALYENQPLRLESIQLGGCDNDDWFVRSLRAYKRIKADRA